MTDKTEKAHAGSGGTRKKARKRKPAPSSPERFRTGPLAEMPEEMLAEALLTTKEVAALLGISPHTVARWRFEPNTDEDPLPFVRMVNNTVRYRLSQIRAWLERREVGTTVQERQIRPQGLQGVVGWSGPESEA